MLDHDEQRRLSEIEAHLRVDAPELHQLFSMASDQNERSAIRGEHPPLGSLAAVTRGLSAVLFAIAITAMVTMVLGPNLGGLVGVLTMAFASMYAYQIIRGCPGIRSRQHP
ncbi:MAG: DUF3040 domain-containing protein [Actinomycetes bacterium]